MTNDTLSYDASSHQIICKGDWVIVNLAALEKLVTSFSLPNQKEIAINGQAISNMDSAGAWLINQWQAQLESKGLKVNLEAFSDKYQTLLSIIKEKLHTKKKVPAPKSEGILSHFGKLTIEQMNGFLSYLSFVGKLSVETLRIFSNPKRFRLGALSSVIYQTGFKALPIIALLSFMIGVVLTYQMGLQLRDYGADIYIVDLLGLAVLREFGPLLTAIMVAGRTGSAYTAQLGIMKINEEIDALDTMGVTPGELLLLPRIFGLVIALPLLSIWSDIFGVVGGMVMSNSMLGITWYDFLHRFPHVIPLKTLLIGLVKTPIFALIISSVGCYEGMQVRGSANSVGDNTTRSVVLSIFFIIVADAAFSVIFSMLKL